MKKRKKRKRKKRKKRGKKEKEEKRELIVSIYLRNIKSFFKKS